MKRARANEKGARSARRWSEMRAVRNGGVRRVNRPGKRPLPVHQHHNRKPSPRRNRSRNSPRHQGGQGGMIAVDARMARVADRVFVPTSATIVATARRDSPRSSRAAVRSMVAPGSTVVRMAVGRRLTEPSRAAIPAMAAVHNPAAGIRAAMTGAAAIGAVTGTTVVPATITAGITTVTAAGIATGGGTTGIITTITATRTATFTTCPVIMLQRVGAMAIAVSRSALR